MVCCSVEEEKISMRFEVFVTVKIQVEIWVVTLHSIVVGYHCFRGPSCIHLQVEVEVP
jgi:hypothetical protein